MTEDEKQRIRVAVANLNDIITTLNAKYDEEAMRLSLGGTWMSGRVIEVVVQDLTANPLPGVSL